MDKIGTRYDASHGCIGAFHRSIGAIVGIAIHSRQPGKHECASPTSYQNQKGFCSTTNMQVQAIAGGCRRFL